jgi:chemotaxis signal transduction protein
MINFKQRYINEIERQNKGEDYALIYSLGNNICVIGLDSVIDILSGNDIRHIPGSVDYFSGIISYEGKSIPVINTFKRLRVEDQKTADLLIYRNKNDYIAFSIGSILQVSKYDKNNEQEISTAETYTIPKEFIDKIIKINDNILYKIKVSSLYY